MRLHRDKKSDHLASKYWISSLILLILFGSLFFMCRNPAFSQCPVTAPPGAPCCCGQALTPDSPNETLPFFYERAMDCMSPDHTCANHCNFTTALSENRLLDKSCIFYVTNSTQCERVEGCEELITPICHKNRSESIT